MTNYTIGDVSYNQDGELEQFLLFWDNGEPDTRRATAENILLFDPEDALPFEGGMQDFFSGNSALKISEDPEIIVSQSGDEYSYILAVDGDVVETTPNQAETFLEGVYDALAMDEMGKLTGMHSRILDTQVRRPIVDALLHTFSESHRIEAVANGWLVDEFYLVDWNAKLYSNKNDPDEGDYVRSGSSVVQKDTSYEFIRLQHSMSINEDVTVTIDGDQKLLTERELVFLAKVTWLLDRRHYHPDKPFWDYLSKWDNVPKKEPDLDQFTL